MEFFLQSQVMALANLNPEILSTQRSPQILDVLSAIGEIGRADAEILHSHYENLIAQSMICSLDQRPRIVNMSDELQVGCIQALKIYAQKGLDFKLPSSREG